MYKCGWNGCEKAYGTLNHLNAHVTMQSHGAKRTPEGMHIPLFRWSLVPSVAVLWQWRRIRVSDWASLQIPNLDLRG